MGFSLVVYGKREARTKCAPVRVKWIALPLCTIAFDRNFDSPIALFYRVSPLWISRLGGRAHEGFACRSGHYGARFSPVRSDRGRFVSIGLVKVTEGMATVQRWMNETLQPA